MGMSSSRTTQQWFFAAAGLLPVCYNPAMRSALVAVAVALAVTASANAGSRQPSATWLAQAQCIHQHEGPWTANTGNGYYGGLQFAKETWLRAGGSREDAFAHPGDARFPFTPTVREQLRVAWRLYLHDGGTWKSWGAVGAACSKTAHP